MERQTVAQWLEPYSIRRGDVNKAFARYALVLSLIPGRSRKDKELRELLKDVISKVVRYVRKVIEHDVTYPLRRHKLEDNPSAFQVEEELVDKERRILHNALMSSLYAFNRNLVETYGWETAGGRVPVGGLFTGDPRRIEDRHEIAEWAVLLFIGLSEHQAL